MAIQFLTYDDKDMESGKFYFIEANKDLAPNLRDVTTITTPLNQATQDITEIKAINDFQGIKINSLETYFEEYKELILDNQSRINNLELTEIQRIMEFIDRVTITKPFVNATRIEIQHSRKIVTNVLVMKQIENTNTRKEYQHVIVDWRNVEELINGVWVKKIIITSNPGITGYAVIL